MLILTARMEVRADKTKVAGMVLMDADDNYEFLVIKYKQKKGSCIDGEFTQYDCSPDNYKETPIIVFSFTSSIALSSSILTILFLSTAKILYMI